jgi:type I restriction enzyme S subunit
LQLAAKSVRLSNLSTHLTKVNDEYKKVILTQQTQIDKLKEYKATLIDSAVTGKIKVS